MAIHYKTEGLVLGREDRSEADRVFTVFSQQFGKIEIFAKAIRKISSKLKGGIELFSLSELEFIEGRNRRTLTDAVKHQSFSSIIADPEKSVIARKISNALQKFLKGQESDLKMWDLLTDVFYKLDQENVSIKNQRFVYYYFLWNLIEVLGYAPQITVCAHCGQKLDPNHLYFSNSQGGVICQNCLVAVKEYKKVDLNVLKLLKLALAKDWKTLSRLKIAPSLERTFNEVLAYYSNYLLATHAGSRF